MINLATLKRGGFHGPKWHWEPGSCPSTWSAVLVRIHVWGLKAPLLILVEVPSPKVLGKEKQPLSQSLPAALS